MRSPPSATPREGRRQAFPERSPKAPASALEKANDDAFAGKANEVVDMWVKAEMDRTVKKEVGQIIYRLEDAVLALVRQQWGPRLTGLETRLASLESSSQEEAVEVSSTRSQLGGVVSKFDTFDQLMEKLAARCDTVDSKVALLENTITDVVKNTPLQSPAPQSVEPKSLEGMEGIKLEGLGAQRGAPTASDIPTALRETTGMSSYSELESLTSNLASQNAELYSRLKELEQRIEEIFQEGERLEEASTPNSAPKAGEPDTALRLLVPEEPKGEQNCVADQERSTQQRSRRLCACRRPGSRRT